jgi:hypothetical protein
MAAALARAIDEHGVPNSFSPGELALRYSDFRAVDFGRAAPRIIAILHQHRYVIEYERHNRKAHFRAIGAPA